MRGRLRREKKARERSPRAAANEDRELPRRSLRGEFIVSEAAIVETERLLPTYRGIDGDHEGIVFWLGRQIEEEGVTIITTALAPEAHTRPGWVQCSKEQMATAADSARAAGLGVLAQVHSHPRGWVEHSEGDDDMIFMPFEGMLSIVVPWYGHVGMRPLDNIGIHQYQDGYWVLAEPASVREAITVVPPSIDVR